MTVKNKTNKNYKRSQKGRSMVEMLGVLAIIGVLSVGGVYGYGVAMKKHKANELLHQASMLAATISAQAMTNDGKLPETITDFGNTNYGTFSTSATNALDGKGFTITISEMDSAVCDQLKAGGMVQGVECVDSATSGKKDAKITYYKNLATNDEEGKNSPTGGSDESGAKPLCEVGNLEGCETPEACQAVGGFWDDREGCFPDECAEDPSTCIGSDKTKSECLSKGGYWCGLKNECQLKSWIYSSGGCCDDGVEKNEFLQCNGHDCSCVQLPPAECCAKYDLSTDCIYICYDSQSDCLADGYYWDTVHNRCHEDVASVINLCEVYYSNEVPQSQLGGTGDCDGHICSCRERTLAECLELTDSYSACGISTSQSCLSVEGYWLTDSSNCYKNENEISSQCSGYYTCSSAICTCEELNPNPCVEDGSADSCTLEKCSEIGFYYWNASAYEVHGCMPMEEYAKEQCNDFCQYGIGATKGTSSCNGHNCSCDCEN